MMVSIPGYHLVQLEQAEAELAERRTTDLLNGFYEEVGQKAMFAAQFIPFDQWPDLLKTAFKHVERERPTCGGLARDRLPK